MKPHCQFYKLISAAPNPQRADRSACGTLPTQAFRYCEPIAAASGFGFYFYPPLNFKLMLDGDEILWTYEGASAWFALSGAAQFPGFVEEYHNKAPDGLGKPPTFLAQGLMPGTVQIWGGYLARTNPQWSLLVRGVSNYASRKAYSNFEGIIESDRWFGPLFTNIRLTRTNSPIEFHTRYPLFQVQPIPASAYKSPSFDVIDDLELEDWRRFDETVKPSLDKSRRLGRYAVDVRRASTDGD